MLFRSVAIILEPCLASTFRHAIQDYIWNHKLKLKIKSREMEFSQSAQTHPHQVIRLFLVCEHL
jgi:hypothetical protein